ncbi:MAG: hypothetical protein LBL19_04135 [Spirochaetaceae bacterium]|jgi:hypothetical protein|nr:hypothetical protein [Spirochaetaceae bacterium]
MFRKDLVFKTLAFFGITLLVLAGCPNVVDDGPDSTTTPEQQDVEIDVSVTKGATALGIKLTAGKFKPDSDQKVEYFKPGEGFSISENAKIKVASDKKSLIIKDCTAAVESQATIKITITKDAFETPSLETDVAKKDTITGGAQEDIDAKVSAGNAAVGHKAIVVTLEGGGLFDSGIAGVDFIHATKGESKIVTTNASPVVVSADKTKATIYGEAGEEGSVKIGIRASALVGYFHVTAGDVKISSAAGYINNSPITPAENDDYITVKLGPGKTFVDEPALKAFTLTNGAGIAIGGDNSNVKLNSGKTKAVIKASSKSTDTTAFALSIDEYVFTLPLPNLDVEGDITVKATQQNEVVIPALAATGATNELVVTIVNGGKFKDISDGATTGFTMTGGTEKSVTFSKAALNSDGTVTITLSGKPNGTVGVTIAKAAFDESWLVEADDITLTWGAGTTE